MACQYARMSDTYADTIEYLNYGFSVIFNIEMIIKIIGLAKRYFTDSAWNRFDFAIVVGTDIGFILSYANIGIDISTTATVIRSFRIMRIFRLLKKYGRVVLDTLVNIIPQITNIMSLIFLLIFIYSVLGISLFADVKYGTTYNSDNNFRTFPKSIVLILRCMTGEDWNLIMDDLTVDTDCNDDQSYDDIQKDGVRGCGDWTSYLYFLTLIFILQMIIINLSVAAVIDGLSMARKDNSAIIKKDEISELIILWSEYDPKATGWIEVTDLVFLLFELPKPLGYGGSLETEDDLNKDEFDDKSLNVSGIIKQAKSATHKYQEKLEAGEISDVHKSYDFSVFDDNSTNKFASTKKKTMKNGDHIEKTLLFNEEREI